MNDPYAYLSQGEVIKQYNYYLRHIYDLYSSRGVAPSFNSMVEAMAVYLTYHRFFGRFGLKIPSQTDCAKIAGYTIYKQYNCLNFRINPITKLKEVDPNKPWREYTAKVGKTFRNNKFWEQISKGDF